MAPHPVPVPAYLIMDDKTRAAGSPFSLDRVMGWAGVVKKVQFSKDNSEEIAKGWFQKADTIADLAAKINRGPRDSAEDAWTNGTRRATKASIPSSDDPRPT